MVFDVEAYQKMLAKIAYGAAILKHGINYFRPLVTDFIRGEEKDGVGKYVFGFDLEAEHPPQTKEPHQMIMLREHVVHEKKYVIGFVRLFPELETPTNAVVVGVVEAH